MDARGRTLEKWIEKGEAQKALELMKGLTLAELIGHEGASEVIGHALNGRGWWGVLFAHRYPLTARRHRSSPRETWLLVDGWPEEARVAGTLPRGAQLARAESEKGAAWSVRRNGLVRHGADKLVVPWRETHVVRRRLYVEPSEPAIALDDDTLVYTARSQNTASVMMFGARSREEPAAYVPHFWALNDGNDPCVDPPYNLMGDLELLGFRAATSEGHGISAVALNWREAVEDQLILFDSRREPLSGVPGCWWNRASSLVPMGDRVVDLAFVLQGSLLLVASEENLFAVPRANPHSLYHVRQLLRPVRFLVSRGNVLCICYRDTLELLRVEPAALDPFLSLDAPPLLRAETAAFGEAERPFLVGPYLVFRNEEGDWVHVDYERESLAEAQVLAFPGLRPGWQLDTVLSCTLKHVGIRVRSAAEGRSAEVLLTHS